MTAPFEYLTYGISLAVVIKFSLDHRFGAKYYCADGSYTAFINERYASEGLARRISASAYRRAYLAKWIGIAALPLGGWLSVVGALIIAFWFLRFEIQYDYKHHTIFLALCSILIALAGPAGLIFASVSSAEDEHTVRYLALILLSQMYLSSAFIKILSPSFRSGHVLRQLFLYLNIEQHRFRFRETILPAAIYRQIATHPLWSAAIFRFLSLSTILLEAGLALALWVPELRPSVILAGFTMHLSFQVILPTRLIPFMVATMTLYFVAT